MGLQGSPFRIKCNQLGTLAGLTSKKGPGFKLSAPGTVVFQALFRILRSQTQSPHLKYPASWLPTPQGMHCPYLDMVVGIQQDVCWL